MSKGLEALGKITSTQSITMYEQNECLKIIKKELKALEIIKKKEVNVRLLLKAFALENGLAFYNENIYFANGILSLTQEEFDLLKEEESL